MGSSVHEFSRQEYWNGLPFPSPEDLLNPGIEPGSPALQADSLLSEPPRKSPFHVSYINYWHMASHRICILFYAAYSDQFPVDRYLSCFHFFFFAVTNNASMTIYCVYLCVHVSVCICSGRGIVGSEVCAFKMLIVCFYLLILSLLLFLSLLICMLLFFKLSIYLAVSGHRCVMRVFCCTLRASF